MQIGNFFDNFCLNNKFKIPQSKHQKDDKKGKEVILHSITKKSIKNVDKSRIKSEKRKKEKKLKLLKDTQTKERKSQI